MDYESISRKLTDQILAGRAAKRLTQESMSFKLGMSVPTYRKVESKPLKCNILTLYRVSEILDCDLLAVFKTEITDKLSC